MGLFTDINLRNGISLNRLASVSTLDVEVIEAPRQSRSQRFNRRRLDRSRLFENETDRNEKKLGVRKSRRNDNGML